MPGYKPLTHGSHCLLQIAVHVRTAYRAHTGNRRAASPPSRYGGFYNIRLHQSVMRAHKYQATTISNLLRIVYVETAPYVTAVIGASSTPV